MSTLTKIEKSIESYRARSTAHLAKLIQRRLDFVRSYLIECVRCHNKNALSSWSFLQASFYVPPRGCNEGDYWVNSEVKVCHIVCPACGHENYIYNHPERATIEQMLGTPNRKHSFNDIFVSVQEQE